MLAAWRAEIEAEPIPELIDLDTAVAAVRAGIKADAAGTRRKRADRLRHLAPVAAAAAFIVLAVGGVALGSAERDARRRAVAGLEGASSASAPSRSRPPSGCREPDRQRRSGARRPATAGARGRASCAGTARSSPEVRPEEGKHELVQVQEFLVAKAAETPPGEPVGPGVAAEESSRAPVSTTAAAPPPSQSSPPTSQLVLESRPDRPVGSRSRSVRTRVRAPARRWSRRPRRSRVRRGRRLPDSGSSEPDGHQGSPTSRRRSSTEGGADATTAPAPSGRRPAGVRGRREPPGVRRRAGRDDHHGHHGVDGLRRARASTPRAATAS